MTDQPTDGKAASDERITDKAHWLTYSQWLYDDLSKAYTATGLQAVTLLGFDGIILSIGGSNLPSDLNCATKYLVTNGIVSVIMSAIVCVFAMIPRGLALVNHQEIQKEWSQAIKSGDVSNAQFQATEHLQQGLENPGGKSPIVELSKAINKRGQLLRISAFATAIGVFLLGLSLIIEIWR